MPNCRSSILTVLLVIFAVSIAAADADRTNTTPGIGEYKLPFYPDAVYRDGVRSPSDFLGFEIGSKPSRYDEIVAYCRYLASTFPNVSLTVYGKTYEGRDLVYLTVTSEENAERLPELREKIAKLADPRLLKGGEADKIIRETPAVAWLAYSIHGDELSSGDAALWLAYQLVAGEDDVTRKIRNEVVACIDPVQNPDGRERWITQLEQWNGVVTNDDVQSMQHRGTWPYGRGNHYLFDLNRDWITLVLPETRARVKAILDWHPQYFVDSHEMGPTDTYLFSPPREPYNPYMIPQIRKWWNILAKDQAAAFDRYGWSYYTREWNEEFYPGYGSSWSIYTGAIGLLYEQAGVDGSIVKRPDGTVMTYRETVHHQFTSSMANLTTVSNHREEILKDYYAEKKNAVGGSIKKDALSVKGGAFLFAPSANKARLERLVETLEGQGVQVFVATKPFTLGRGISGDSKPVSNVRMAAGTVIVPLDQPLHALVLAILSFDIRVPTRFLEIERKENLEKNDTKIYENTAWSLSLAYNVECYFANAMPSIDAARPAKELVGGVTGRPAKFGFVFDGTDDRSYALLARLFEKGYEVWCSREPFEVEGKKFARGSFLIKGSANPKLDGGALDELARSEGVDMFGVNTALATTGADLGGGEFFLLEPPRIGIVGGAGTSTDCGGVWQLLDAQLRYRCSIVDVAAFRELDLRKYNVLVFPSTWGGPDLYQRVLGKAGIERLKTWIEAGGTMITMGSATAFAADTSVAISSIRERRDVLKKLPEYGRALEYAKAAASPVVDSLSVWEVKPSEQKKEEKKPAPPDVDALKDADDTARKLCPRGAILAVDLDEKHWLTFGVRSPVPVLVSTDCAFLAKSSVQIAGKFAPRERIRLSGLLWPEARERWSETAFAVRESRGNGQVILFADSPDYRNYFYGGERLLLNAIFLGPGFGTRQAFY